MRHAKNSEQRLAAQRANARLARGRKSAAGRASSAQNARRHGLSLPLLADPSAGAEVAALARAIAASSDGPRASMPSTPIGGADPVGESALEALARRIAEAQLEVLRVRRARHDAIARALADPDYDSPRVAALKAEVLKNATSVAARLRRPDPFLDLLVAGLRETPHGPRKLALILADLARELAAFDRYESAARARRKRAIRAFDEERLRVCENTT